MTNKVQHGDGASRRSRPELRRTVDSPHLNNQQRRFCGMPMRAANETKQKIECGDAVPSMYFLIVTHRKHSSRNSVKVIEAVVEQRYTTGRQMLGRPEEQYGFRSPQGEQLLPGAQCA